MSWDSQHAKSAWREFYLVLNEVRRAIGPGIELNSVFVD